MKKSTAMWPTLRAGLLLIGLAFPAGSLPAGSPERGPMPHLVDLYGEPLPEGALARLGTLAFRHTDRVSAAAVSPDGRQIATATEGRHVYLWDAATGRPLRDITTDSWRCRALAFGPGGNVLAVAGDSVSLYDPATGRLRARVTDRAHESYVALSFSPDGNTLAVGTAGASVTTDTNSFDVPAAVLLIDVLAGRKVGRLGEYDAMVEGVAFSPAGSVLAAASRDNTVRLWDPGAGKELSRLPAGKIAHTRVAFSPDGRRLASGAWDGYVTLWDLAKGQAVWREAASRQPVQSLSFSPDGSGILTGADYSPVHILEARTGRLRPGIAGLDGLAWHGAFTPDGKSVVAWGDDHCVHIWNPATNTERPSGAGHRGSVPALAVSSDGGTIASAGNDGIRLWEVGTGRELRRLADREYCTSVSFSPDGKTVAGVHKCTATVWETGTGRGVRDLDLDGWRAAEVAFAPGGKAIFTADFAYIRATDVSAGKPVARIEVRPPEEGGEPGFSRPPPALSSLGISPDGKTVAVMDVAQVRLWDVATAKEDKRLPDDLSGPLAFSPDGRTLVCGRGQDAICFWDLRAGKEAGRIKLRPGRDPWALAVAPDGRSVAGACADGVMRVWSFPAGAEQATFRGHAGAPACVAYTPDGKALVSGGGNTTVLVWDLRQVGKR